MKKYEEYFKDDRDFIIFPLLIRSMKETNSRPNCSVEEFINKCLNSRSKHPSESYYENISYWPEDLRFLEYNYSALFLARIINLKRSHTRFSYSRIFINNFIRCVGFFYSSNISLQCEVFNALMKIKNCKAYSDTPNLEDRIECIKTLIKKMESQ